MSSPKNDLPSRNELENVQKKHLHYVEDWGRNAGIEISGVPVLLPFSYELVQLLNNRYLVGRLS